ncbi:hypothetical protein QBC47DRAFT_359968 [Echria macrotheca]|uniref:Uncharacterized protein n=1 Tax=Echria macrotheca TaxID=438768 RepID=A0AAJ0F713_9PEZI|nr:hypothetical protein QBC47DRAFT_359968 [Echria macrotheca]
MAWRWQMVCLIDGLPLGQSVPSGPFLILSNSRFSVSSKNTVSLQSFHDDVNNRSAAAASCLGVDLGMANMFLCGGWYLSAKYRDRTFGGGELLCAAVVTAYWRAPLKMGRERTSAELGFDLSNGQPPKVDTSSLDNPSSAHHHRCSGDTDLGGVQFNRYCSRALQDLKVEIFLLWIKLRPIV